MPALPFLGVYLTDLTFLELGNPDNMPDSNYIYFEKRRKVYQLVEEFKKYQGISFSFSSSTNIQDYLRKLMQARSSTTGFDEAFDIMDEDELYDKSFEFEPKVSTSYAED